MVLQRSDAALAAAFVALVFLFSFSRQLVTDGSGSRAVGTVAAALITFFVTWAVIRWARAPGA